MPANLKSVYFEQSQGVMWEHPSSLQTPLFRTLRMHPTNIRTSHFSASSSSANHKLVCFDHSQRVLWEQPASLQTALFRTLPNRAHLRTAHFSASSHRPVRSITNQLISTNHMSVYSDQSQAIHQPNGPNKRRPLWPVKSVWFRYQLHFVLSAVWTL